MKKIFVTVAEFILNGGKLSDSRVVYEPNEFGYGYDKLENMVPFITVENSKTLFCRNRL